MTAEDRDAIRQIIREEVRAAFGNPIAQPSSLEQRAARNREIKMQELAEKRAKRTAKKSETANNSIQ